MSADPQQARRPWVREEVEAIVADYLHMLMQEMAGQSYNKSEHRRALQLRLDQRSDASIENKHQNISAVMIALGCFYIEGYKPLGNYQSLLREVVEQRLADDPRFDDVAMAAAEQPAVMPLVTDLGALLAKAPQPSVVKDGPAPTYQVRTKGVVRDYLVREARNRSLGAAGELLVVEYERHCLRAAGKQTLSERVEHVAASRGDGLGYDVLSFDHNGRERLIEVKTTTFGAETPFYVSHEEVALSGALPDQFHLYRLYGFRSRPRLFDLSGDVRGHCRLDPVSFLARLG